MNKTVKWVLIGLGIALLVFLIALPVFYMVLHRGGMMGLDIYGRAGRMMMPVPFFGFLGFFRILLPLGLIALVVVGIVLLARGGRSNQAAPLPAQPAEQAQPVVEQRICRKCGKPLNTEGEYCPFCGKKQ